MNILDKIISISEDLFMTYGLKSISMDDIAKALGMSKKTIYKYVDNKDKLIKLAINKRLKYEKEIILKITSESENAMEEFINMGNHIIRIVSRLRPAIIFDLKKYHAKNWKIIEDHQFNFIRGVIQKNIERGMKEGIFRKNLNPNVIARLYIGKSITLGDEKNFPLNQISKDELLRQHLLYHLFGILSEKGFKLLEKYEIEAV